MNRRTPRLQIGLDIGQCSIKAVALEAGTDKIHSFHSVNLADYDPAQAEIDGNPILLNLALKEIFKTIPVRKADINLCLSVDYNNIFILTIPWVNDSEIKSTIFWELEPMLPEMVNRYELDYLILNRDRKNKQIVLLVGVIPLSKIAAVLTALDKHNIHLPAIDIDTLAVLDIFLAAFSDKITAPLGILTLGAEHTGYIIVAPDSVPEFLTLNFGGNSIDKIIARTRGMSLAAARAFRHSEGLYTKEILLEDQAGSEMQAILKTAVDFATDIVHFNTNYNLKTGQKVSQVYATGGLAHDGFMHDFLAKHEFFLNIPSILWDPLGKLTPKKGAENQNLYQYTAALGMALRREDAL